MTYAWIALTSPEYISIHSRLTLLSRVATRINDRLFDLPAAFFSLFVYMRMQRMLYVSCLILEYVSCVRGLAGCGGLCLIVVRAECGK